MFKEYIKPILVLTAICLALSGLLAVVNNATQPVITEAAAERALEAMYQIMPEATGFEQINHEFPSDINQTVKEAYRAVNDIGYVFIASNYGYSGEIRIICAIDNDGRIIEVRTLSHTETAGIGTVIEEDSFLTQFTGADKNLTGVDTVTGATVSTSAFIYAVDGIYSVFEIISEQEAEKYE